MDLWQVREEEGTMERASWLGVEETHRGEGDDGDCHVQALATRVLVHEFLLSSINKKRGKELLLLLVFYREHRK